MYQKYDTLNLPAIDAEILKFWAEQKIFQKSVDNRPAENSFVFYEGPPSANGKPGIHHVMARTVKDLFCRYQTLNGKRVERKGGWDTHGLPIELQVEKELGITKEDIGTKISVDDYNHACRQTVMRYKDLWDDVTIKMGYWVDLDNPYITFQNEYIETVWWILKRLYEKKTAGGDPFLYKSYTIQPFSPAAGTGLSTHELNMPGCYKEVTDTSVVAMFKVKIGEKSAQLFDSENEDVRILAWTTTPWTLPSNVALTVGQDIEYVKVRTFSPYTGDKVSLILAKARLGEYFPKENDALPFADFKLGDKKIPFNIVKTGIRGAQLVDIQYEQLLPSPEILTENVRENGFRIIAGDWVTTEDGTGVVHTAPYFGADDFRACKAAGVPFIGIFNEKNPDLPFPLVDRQGRFVPEVPLFGGRFVKEEYYSDAEREAADFKATDLLIALYLKENNKAFNVKKYAHNYPHCWRTDKPVLYYPLDSWFIRASAAKERLSELNKTINWKPEATGTGRFGTWLDNLQDWNLSRSRYWGIGIPIWRTEDQSEEICIGSILELSQKVDEAVRAGFMASNPFNPTPGPFPKGRGEPQEDAATPLPFGEGSGVGLKQEQPPSITGYGVPMFKTDHARWQYLKQFAKGNRKTPTESEDILWQALRGKQIDGVKFRRQHAIEDYIVDFVSLEFSLVVEVDGAVHEHFEEYDQYRTAILKHCGYELIRFTNGQVEKELPVVLKEISGKLAEIRAFRENPTPDPSPKGRGVPQEDAATPLPFGEGSGVGLYDLHRPYIDEIILVSSKNEPMRRELDLIDVWFDSGSMPYAQWGLDQEKLAAGDPVLFKNPFPTSFPASFIAEGVDQTRGWFYTLHAIAGMVFDSVAFQNVVSNGLVLDKEGNKMSKSKGNVVDPFETLGTFGADATRWYMMANANPWDNLKFDTAGILEVRNKLFGTLFNTYQFFATYANLDGWKMDETAVISYENRPELDRWVISKLYSLVAEYRAAMDDYDVTRACRAIESFVDEHLSNWFVRLSRRRFWKSDSDFDKKSAYQTIFEAMMVVGQLMAPVAPFFSDWLYQKLTDPIREKARAINSPLRHESVHLTDLLENDPSKIDLDLETRMDYAQRISSLVLSIRKKEKIRVRQPLQKILLPVLDPNFIKQIEGVSGLILTEVNVKEIEFITDSSGLIKKKAKANFKTLGAKLGKDMKAAADLIAVFTNEEINDLEKTGSRPVTINGNNYSIAPEDLVVTTEDLPGWQVANDGPLTVALDITLSDELRAEGMARELVNRIQNLRKESDFLVSDRISVKIERHEAILEAVGKFEDFIKNEVLATSLEWADVLHGDKIELAEDILVGIEVRVN